MKTSEKILQGVKMMNDVYNITLGVLIGFTLLAISAVTSLLTYLEVRRKKK